MLSISRKLTQKKINVSFGYFFRAPVRVVNHERVNVYSLQRFLPRSLANFTFTTDSRSFDIFQRGSQLPDSEEFSDVFSFFFCILWHTCLQVGTLHWHYASDASRRTLCSNVLGSGSLEDRTGSSGAGTVWRYFGSNAEVEK